MTIGNLVKGSKFLCETSLVRSCGRGPAVESVRLHFPTLHISPSLSKGYKMDDLITSYVNMYLRDRRPAQARSRRFNV